MDTRPYYNKTDIECIEIIELMPFCLGNAFKYVYRAGFKDDEREDVEKAIYYLNRQLNIKYKPRYSRYLDCDFLQNFEAFPKWKKNTLWFIHSSRGSVEVGYLKLAITTLRERLDETHQIQP